MSDTKPTTVVDLASERIKRDPKAGAEAHAKGEAMEFMRYAYDPRGIGYDPDGDPRNEVMIVINGHGKGLSMSAADAFELGKMLMLAAANAPSRRKR
jgi:hypothetical protein